MCVDVCASVYPTPHFASSSQRTMPTALFFARVFTFHSFTIFHRAMPHGKKKLVAVTGSRKRSQSSRYPLLLLLLLLAGYLPALLHGITQLPPPVIPARPRRSYPHPSFTPSPRVIPRSRSLIGSTRDKSQRHRLRRERRSHQI